MFIVVLDIVLKICSSVCSIYTDEQVQSAGYINEPVDKMNDRKM